MMVDWKQEIRKQLAGVRLAPVREAEIVEELAQHFESLYEELLRDGASVKEATQALMAELKDSSLLEEQLRWLEREAPPEAIVFNTRKGNIVMDLWQDLRFSLRNLRKSPGFTAIAVLTLALGIGANTAMFSVLNTYLFRALPYPQSERLVRIYRTSPHSQSWPHSPANFYDFRDQNEVFESLSAYSAISINMSEPGAPAERVQCITATADYFQALGVQPILGRVFTAEEEMIPNNGVVLLSHPYWMRRFGGDPGVVGRTVKLNGWDAQVIGVMPPGVEHPLLWGTVDMWGPQAFTAESRRERDSNFLHMMGRLKPGVSIKQAEDSMVALFAHLAEANSSNSGESLRLEPLQRSLSDDIGRTVMWFTFGLAGFVLAIACANLANLQLVRTAARSREYAVRAALGAGRGRLIRQSLTESLVISLIGGALSLVVALWGVEFISHNLFSELPGANVSVDFSVFGFALLISVLTGLVFGLLPAWFASRTDVSQALSQNARGSTASRSHNRLRHALIIGEVAFALILLTGAGLFLRGLQRFTHQDPGWEVDGMLTAQVGLQGPRYVNSPERAVFCQQLEERLSNLPGVEGVGLSLSHPAFELGSSGSFRVEGEPEPEPGKWPEAYVEPVSPHYFETIKARLLEGRVFTPEDKADRPPIVIINRAMAERFWPNESAVGKRIGRGTGPNPWWAEVVGVVSDIGAPANLSEPYTRFQTFMPLATQPPWGRINISLRTSVAPESMTNALRSAVAEVDSSQAIFQIQTARSTVNQGLGSISLLGNLLSAFAALGLALAAIGIYGVMSYSVAQRRGEIGIRMALGARQQQVLWLILSKGVRLSLLGTLIGLGGGYGVAKLLQWAIPTLPTNDLMAFVVIAVILVVVALMACWLPARRAMKVNPMEALRCE
jgi:predicted permease